MTRNDLYWRVHFTLQLLWQTHTSFLVEYNHEEIDTHTHKKKSNVTKRQQHSTAAAARLLKQNTTSCCLNTAAVAAVQTSQFGRLKASPLGASVLSARFATLLHNCHSALHCAYTLCHVSLSLYLCTPPLHALPQNTYFLSCMFACKPLHAFFITV